MDRTGIVKEEDGTRRSARKYTVEQVRTGEDKSQRTDPKRASFDFIIGRRQSFFVGNNLT